MTKLPTPIDSVNVEQLFGVRDSDNGRVFCISMPGSKRTPKALASIRAAGFGSVQLCPQPVRGSDIQPAELERLLTVRALRDLNEPRTRAAHEDIHSLGCVGCSLSHYNLWKLQIEQGWQRVLIFEDDPVFVARFAMLLQSTLSDIELADTNWELLSLGHSTIKGSADQHVKTRSGQQCPLLRRGISTFHGTAAYCVTLAGARKLIADFLPMDAQVDGYIGLLAHPQRLDRLNLYFQSPPSVTQDWVRDSSITRYESGYVNWKLEFPCSDKMQNLLFAIIIMTFFFAYLFGLWAGLRGRRSRSSKQWRTRRNK